MISALLVLAVFFLATLAAGRSAERARLKRGPDESFYLADRRLGSLALFLTLAATNFSAFTVLGLAGAGYRLGYAFYPVMGLGTAFMVIGLYLVGLPFSEAGARRGWVTPADFVEDRYGSPLLKKAYAIALVAFTLPYLALQPIAAGLLLESALGVPYVVGAVSVAAVIALYTILGGMRAVVRTDVFHGVLLMGIAALAWWLVVRRLGGFVPAHELVAERSPALLARPGGGAGLSPAAYAGYFLLWLLADPLFPQLNQRFLAARDGKAMRRTIVAYPFVTTTLFFLTVSTGVLGSMVLPGLGGAGADRIWPALAAEAAPAPFSGVATAFLLLAPLAALMTTMDSQLLTLASVAVRDLAGRKDAPPLVSRTAVALLALVGAALALVPPDDILAFLNKSSFLGYAAMAPLFFCGLYSSRPGPIAGLASLVLGEAAVVLSGFGLLDVGGLPPVFTVAAVSWGTLALGTAIGAARGKRRPPAAPRQAAFQPYRLAQVLPARWALVFLAVLVPAFDFWNWGKEPRLAAGLPLWVWTSAGLGVLLSAALSLFFRHHKPHD